MYIKLVGYLPVKKENIQVEEQHIEQQVIQMEQEQEDVFCCDLFYLYYVVAKGVMQPIAGPNEQEDVDSVEQVQEEEQAQEQEQEQEQAFSKLGLGEVLYSFHHH